MNNTCCDMVRFGIIVRRDRGKSHSAGDPLFFVRISRVISDNYSVNESRALTKDDRCVWQIRRYRIENEKHRREWMKFPRFVAWTVWRT